jgi:broad specificity phosphatase PhoE
MGGQVLVDGSSSGCRDDTLTTSSLLCHNIVIFVDRALLFCATILLCIDSHSMFIVFRACWIFLTSSCFRLFRSRINRLKDDISVHPQTSCSSFSHSYLIFIFPIPTMRISLLSTVALSAVRTIAYTAAPKTFGSRSVLRMATSSAEQQVIAGPTLPDLAPTAKRLFLVRHGEVINPGGDRPVYYGAMDVSLSPLGEQEAVAAGQYLQQFDLQHVACSPLSRAVFGARQVAELQEQDDELIVIDGFSELDRGAWCGLTLGEIGADMMERFDACDETVTPENGESYPFVKDRVLKARDQILAKMDAGRSAAVVSHLQVTRCMLSEAIAMPAKEMAALKIATASVTCIDYDGDVQTVHFQSFKPDMGLAKSNDGAN